jgi:hypothetical protein
MLDITIVEQRNIIVRPARLRRQLYSKSMISPPTISPSHRCI